MTEASKKIISWPSDSIAVCGGKYLAVLTGKVFDESSDYKHNQ